MGELSGKTAIVTGASSGIGRGIASVLAREECRLLVTCRSNVDGLRSAVEEFRPLCPEIVPLQVDISRMADIEKLAETAREKFGRVDILVNNAGVTDKYSFLDAKEADFDKVVGINFRGTYFCAQKIARMMVSQKRGKIINISSLTTKGAMEHFSIYSATKAAINKFTEIMALELASYNIQVNAIAAGWIRVGEELHMSEAREKRCLHHIPLGRFGIAEDVGEVVAFLASDRSDYITGQSIFADGGQSMLLSIPSDVRDRRFSDKSEGN